MMHPHRRFDACAGALANTLGDTFRDTFKAWLNAADMPDLPDSVAVGWSGGADSTALLLALACSGRHVMAWHVDHGWREASAREAEQLAEQAAAWGIAFVSARLAPTSHVSEAEARTGRYAQFQTWSRQYQLATLCLGHHRDDQAETVCMRLLQGAGVAGCRGMWRQRQIGALCVVRPLLHLPAITMRQTMTQAGICWFEDPSNRDMRIWRNRIRHQLFPAITKAGVAPDILFLRWQRQAECVAARLDAVVDVLMLQLSQTETGLCLPWALWVDALPSARARLLQKCMLQLLGDGVTPGRRHIILVEAWTKKSGRGGLDLSRCRLYRERDYLHLRPVTAAFGRDKQPFFI